MVAARLSSTGTTWRCIPFRDRRFRSNGSMVARMSKRPPRGIEAPRPDLSIYLNGLGRQAKASARRLALAPTRTKNEALTGAAAALRRNASAVLDANRLDLEIARGAGRPAAFLDRLTLTRARLEATAAGLEDIAALPDPVGATIAAWDR